LVVYDGFFQRIGTGVTDENGIVFLKSDESPVSEDVENPWKKNIRYVVTDGQDVHFAFASSDWGSGVSPYDFGIWSDFYSPPDNLTAYVYTDRPIYRPGQPVYFKGIVRWNDDLIYNLPQIKEVTVKINSFDETVYEESLPLNDFGSFSAKLELDKEAALGSYSIDVYLPNLKDIPTEKFRESSLGGVTFSVAEYHKPEFEVNVSTDKTDVLSGDSFIANIAAHYYSGGNVPDADVNWALTTETFSFTPPDDYIQYSFYDDEEDAGRWQEREHIYEVIAEGKGKTDVNGQLALDFKADLGKYKTSQSLTLEATLTDISGNQVSGRTLLTAHQSKQYPGIMSTEYVGKVAKPVTFQVVVLDWQGNPVPRQSVSVDFYERRWSSVQEQNPDGSIEWKTSVENNLLQRSTGLETAQDGKVSLDFIPSKGGVFKALVTTQDDQGNTNKSAAYIWVAGQEYIPWRQTNNRSFDLITDRKTYEPGDTAEILIASPFEGESYALLTVERGRVRSYEVIRLTSNSTLYHLPLTADMIPNVYISAVVIKGAPPANPQDTAPNIPDFKMGMREIKVKPEEKALTVEVTPSPSQAGPGDEVTYSLKITDKEGKPVHAEVSLALSDLSTLRLVDPNSRPILDFFYSRRDLGVTTTVPIVLSVEGYNAAIEEYITDGRGGGGGGGKGGADTLGVPKVRENFPDTAFWKGHVETDDNGVASVQVSLPDNLTTWRMDARAVTIDTRVGQNTVDIVSSKPLLIRPQTPRFFVSGDRAKVGMAVHNNTQENLDVEVALDTKGFSLLNQAKSSVQIPAASQAYVSWEGTVAPDAKWVDLVFQAKSGNYSDASRPTIGSASIGADGGEKGLPVYRYEVMETVGTAGLITDGNAPSEKVIARSESISLPVFKDTSATDIKGSLDVELSSSLAAAMLPGLDYLKHYPYECTEQTISRFLPNIFTLAMLDAAQVENEDLHANLNEQINVALQRLYKQQNPDGGWGWWGANQKSDLQTSAYVVFGMQSALGSGATVNKEVLQRAIEYLNANLVFTKDLQSRSELNTQAFVLFVLAAAQKPAVSNTVQLYEARQSLSHYGRAFLALALSIIDSQDPRLKTLQSDFTNAAILSATGAHWEETVRDYYGWNTNTRTSALVLLALLAIDPQNELNANAVRWLMSNRSDNGHWSTTQDTVWTIIALTSWSFSSKDLQAEYKYTAALNGKQLGNNEWQQAQAITSLSDASALKPYELTVDVQNMLADQLNRLTIARTQGPGTLYYTAHLNVSLPAEKVGSLNRGIIISRNYFHPNNPRLPITKVERGDTILARLTIVAPSDLHYIVIDDPLPAGLEAVDQSLLTNARATAPSTESPTRQPGEVRTWLDDVFARGWGWEFFEHVEMRDEKVVLSASYLPAGTYTYTYLVRAGSSGEFRVIPPTAREFYFPEVYGRGTGSVFQVLDK